MSNMEHMVTVATNIFWYDFLGVGELNQWKRGRHGVRQRLQLQGHWRIPPVTIIHANAQSLRNKTDCLQSNVSFLTKHKNVSLITLMEGLKIRA